jgi:hypothetical protein
MSKINIKEERAMIMNTSQDVLVAMLRKKETDWLVQRWIGVIVGGLNVAMGLYSLIRISYLHSAYPQLIGLMLPYVIPLIYFFAGSGAVLLSYSIRNWQGDIKTKLLLKLAKPQWGSVGSEQIDKAQDIAKGREKL